jgi:hypothetical protein
MMLKAPQNLPKRSKMRRAWPTPVTAPETQDHLLVHIKNGNQEKQRPQECGPVVLASLGIGAEGAGVIVADHDDETWAENGEKGLEPVLPAFPGTVVALPDGAEGAVDVAGKGVVENGRAGGRHIRDCIHGSSPDPRSGAGEPWRRQPAGTSAPASMAGFVLWLGLFPKPAFVWDTAKAGQLGPSFNGSSFVQAASRGAE